MPVLWDRDTQRVLSNDSSEILRFFTKPLLYPIELRSKIDEVNSWMYSSINNAPYQAGFADTQIAYEQAVQTLFNGLDRVESLLSTQKYICGDQLTEADVKLLPSLIRFDVAYYSHFKCNINHLWSYKSIQRYMNLLLSDDRILSTVNIEQIKRHYFLSVPSKRHIPLGPLFPT